MSLYFRLRPNGATVFRVIEADRLTLTPLADIVLRSGAIKPRSDDPTAEETAEIERWLAARRVQVEADEAATPERAIEAMNAAAHWISGKPDSAAAEASSEDMLMALHDLRSAIVRWKANKAAAGDGD